MVHQQSSSHSADTIIFQNTKNLTLTRPEKSHPNNQNEAPPITERVSVPFTQKIKSNSPMNYSQIQQNTKSHQMSSKIEKMTPIEQTTTNLSIASPATQSRVKEKIERPIVEALPIQQFNTDLKAHSTPHQSQHIANLQNQKEKLTAQENIKK